MTGSAQLQRLLNVDNGSGGSARTGRHLVQHHAARTQSLTHAVNVAWSLVSQSDGIIAASHCYRPTANFRRIASQKVHSKLVLELQIQPDVERSCLLIMRPSALRYPNKFWNASATNESGLDQFRRLSTDFSQNWLPWQGPLSDRKKVRSFICNHISIMY